MWDFIHIQEYPCPFNQSYLSLEFKNIWTFGVRIGKISMKGTCIFFYLETLLAAESGFEIGKH